MCIISKDNKIKARFDYFMLLMACYSTFTSAYFAGFGIPDIGTSLWYLDWGTELFFLTDIIIIFNLEIVSKEDYKIIRSHKLIALNYLKGSLIYDVLALFPFELLVQGNVDAQKIFKLFKLLRLPRMFAILSFRNF